MSRPWLASLFVALALASGETARADADVLPTDPGCVHKFGGQLCALPDGSGGVCARGACGKADDPRACLRCVPTAKASDPNVPWVPMIAFGVTVFIVGLFFWLRLSRKWDADDDAQRRSRS